MFTTNQITSALVAYRSAADQDTATASSIAAALLSYYTIAQVDGLLTGKLGVTEAASALQIAVRFPDDGGADEVVAAIGEQILGPTDVSLSNWTVSERGRLHPDPGGEPVEHRAHLQLDPGPRAPLRLPHRLDTASYMSEADNVYDPLHGSFVGDQGAWSTAKMYFTVPPQAPGLPNQTAGTVDVYGLQILDATLEAGNTAEEDTAASALLLKHEFLDGGADDVTLATLGKVLLELHADAGETLLLRLPVPAGHGLQLGDVRQRGRQRLRGRHRHLPRHGLAGRLEHGAPPGGIAKLRFGAFGGSIPGLVQQSAGTLDLYSMQIRASAFEGESVSVTDLLADLLALTASATLEGQRGLRPAAVQRRELHRRVHRGRGRLGRSLLRCAHSHRHRRRSHAVVHGGPCQAAR